MSRLWVAAFALCIALTPQGAIGSVSVNEFVVHDLEFTPNQPVYSLVRIAGPDPVEAALYKLTTQQVLDAAQRGSSMQPADVADLAPVKRFTSVSESSASDLHRIELGTLPPGIYALSLRGRSAAGVQLITISSIGVYICATDSHVYAIAPDLTTMRARTDVTFTFYRGEHVEQRHPGEDGLVDLMSGRNESHPLVVVASDGSTVIQNVQSDSGSSDSRAYMTTDRRVYQPGQTVRFWAVGREGVPGNSKPMSGTTWLYVGNHTTNLYYDHVMIAEHGVVAGAFVLPASIADGDYGVSSMWGDARFSVSTSNATIKPYVLHVLPLSRTVEKNGVARFRVSVRDVFGRPISGVSIHGEAGYSVWEDAIQAASLPLEHLVGDDALTGINGQADLLFSTTERQAVESVVVRVTARSGEWTDQAVSVIKLAMGPERIEMHATTNGDGQIQTDFPFSVALLAPDGTPEAGRAISISIDRLYYDDQGKQQAVLVSRQTLLAGPCGVAIVHFTPPTTGVFVAHASTRGTAASPSVTGDIGFAVPAHAQIDLNRFNYSYVFPCRRSAAAGERVDVRLFSSQADGDALLKTGSGEPALSVVHVKDHEANATIAMPAHGTKTNIGFMVPVALGLGSDGSGSIDIAPPADALHLVVRIASTRAGAGTRLAVAVRNRQGEPVKSFLLISVVRSVAASQRIEPRISAYDAVWQTWEHQSTQIQSWYGLNNPPTSYVLPPPAPGASTAAATPGAPTSSSPPSPAPALTIIPAMSGPRSADTVLWLPGIQTDRGGHAGASFIWPKKADVYQMRVIAITDDGKVGEAEVNIVVR